MRFYCCYAATRLSFAVRVEAPSAEEAAIKYVRENFRCSAGEIWHILVADEAVLSTFVVEVNAEPSYSAYPVSGALTYDLKFF